jgi:hypothetical protein
MVAKLKDKFIPKDYKINLFRRLQNLRQKGMIVKEYIDDFYRLNIRDGYKERDEEKIVRYINDLRYEIQNKISMMIVKTVEDAYHIALKVEEKLARKKSQQSRGRILTRGKRIAHDKAQNPKGENQKPHSHSERGGSSRGRQSGGRNYFPRGRGRGIGGEVRCNSCGNTGHMSWECPERKKEGGEDHILESWKRNVEAKGEEYGIYLMMKKVLLNPESEVENPMQRNSLFRTACKTKDGVCKVIIDSGSTDNLVSIEMVENLEMETTAHPSLYKVLWLQKSHQVIVTKQCLVEFKIGGYRDNYVQCDSHGCMSCFVGNTMAVWHKCHS